MFRIGKSLVMESRLVFAEDSGDGVGGWGGTENDC